MTSSAMAQKPGLRNTDDSKFLYAHSPDDMYESAFEEASEKLFHSVWSFFSRRDTSLPFPDLIKGPRRSQGSVRKKQIFFQRGTSVVFRQFATTSFSFAPTSSCRDDGNAKENAQTDASETCHKLSSASSAFVSKIASHESAGSMEGQQMCTRRDVRSDLQINPDQLSVNKPQKVFMEPTGRFSMASLTFASVNKYHHEEDATQEIINPSIQQLFSHPLALISYIPKDVCLFLAGAVAGATAKTVTAPLDRIKLLMQVYRLKAAQEISKRSIGFLEAAAKIGEEEGMRGYWKGNLPQVIRVVPYSAVQLLSYELYKKLFKGNDNELSVAGRLAAGACAGMTSTLVTYPLDVLRLRLAVDPTSKTMIQVLYNS